MPSKTVSRLAILLLLALTVIVYSNGLNGPFLFDDHIHITQNQWVKIDSLDWQSLQQAWNSSFSNFPSDRPLAQLSFGITHALAGLDPWAYKTVNLAIHLLTGLFVFLFSRLAYRAVSGGVVDPARETLLGVAVAAVWLLHPLHVSTVLYPVQRMAQLSTLSLLMALSAYLWGRLRVARGKPGLGWMLAAAPIAVVGFLGKENTVLLPLLLLVCELTLLQTVSQGNRVGRIRLIQMVFIILPILAGLAYLATHPGLLSHDGRPFTFEERLLTQPRVLWHYLYWLFTPDISLLGLFHDDIPNSTGLLDPPTTLAAIIGLVTLLIAAIVYRSRAPLFSFAVLFFLAGHALESSIFPLEMIFEHRNYLASVGPLLLLAYLVTIFSERSRIHRAALVLGVLLLIAYTAATAVRVSNWSSYQQFLLTSAENHPNSPRSNFMAAQMLISALSKAEGEVEPLADTARFFLNNGLAADPACINCLFGLIVLDLHLDKAADPQVLQRLRHALRDGVIDPTKISVSQFSYLVRWVRGNNPGLSRDDLEALFEAALANPRWNSTGRASIEAAYREYYEYVVEDLEAALVHARAAVRAWKDPWNYHMAIVRILGKLGRHEEAIAALDGAQRVAGNEKQKMETAAVRAQLTQAAGN